MQDHRKWHLQKNITMVLQWTGNHNMHLRYPFFFIHYTFCYLQVWIYNITQCKNSLSITNALITYKTIKHKNVSPVKLFKMHLRWSCIHPTSSRLFLKPCPAVQPAVTWLYRHNFIWSNRASYAKKVLVVDPTHLKRSLVNFILWTRFMNSIYIKHLKWLG